MIQDRPSPQYATLDVYNPFEVREVRVWRAQKGRVCAIESTLRGTGGTSACKGRKEHHGLSSLRQVRLPWDGHRGQQPIGWSATCWSLEDLESGRA